MTWRRCILLVILLAPPTLQAGEESAQPLAKRQRQRILTLIDRLVDTAETDFGYSDSVTGTAFLPVDAKGELLVGMLFRRSPVPSKTMRELVKEGAGAVPQLLEHLTDKRRTKIRIGQGLDVFVADDDPKPADGKNKAEKKGNTSRQPRVAAYTLTVGDLCYVALGQILNRDYKAVSYIPSGIVCVMTPTRSSSIAKEVRAEWGALTPAKHRASLIADLIRHDNNSVRVGAAKRLAYYYPEALAEAVLKLLKEPVYEASVVEDFTRNHLYKAKDAKETGDQFDAFLKRHGSVYRPAIQLKLCRDLWLAEARSEPKRHEELLRLLTQLYGKPEAATYKDVLRNAAVWSDLDLVRFITDGLSYNDRTEADAAVRDLLWSTKIERIAACCIDHLIGRGFDTDLENYLRLHGASGNMFREKQGWTRLHLAVENKYVERVRDWIAAHKEVNVAAHSGTTPLHLAAAAGSDDILTLLRAAKANVEAKDKAGRAPLQLAVANDHLDAARLLMANGAAPSDMLTAAFVGRVDLVQRLLDSDRSMIRQTTEKKMTPLHLAAWEGHAKVVSLLLRHGAPVAPFNEDGCAPLHLVAYRGHDEVVRTLLDHKAEVNTATEFGDRTSLPLAVQAGQLSTAKILVQSGADAKAKWSDDKYSLLHIAASGGHPKVLAWLMTLGLPVDGRSDDGHTPLHYAAQFGHVSCVQFLLEHKANVNATAENDDRPLSLAITGGHLEVVRVLLRHNAEMAWTNSWNESPAELATAYDAPEIAALLRQAAPKK